MSSKNACPKSANFVEISNCAVSFAPQSAGFGKHRQGFMARLHLRRPMQDDKMQARWYAL